MKAKVFSVVLVFLLLLCSCSADNDDARNYDEVTTTTAQRYANGDTVVYVTRTGECYHRKNCSYLKSRIETTLEEAVADGYRRCSRCTPPKLKEIE